MKFVTGRENCANQGSDKKQDRDLHLPASAAAQRAPKQHCQNRIFHEVAEFSNRELDLNESEKRNLRVKPAQKRHKETRRMLGRKDIGRTEENYRHPNN